MNHQTDSLSPCMCANCSNRTRRSVLSAAMDCDGVGGVTRTSTAPEPSEASLNRCGTDGEIMTFTVEPEWLTESAPVPVLGKRGVSSSGSGEPSTLSAGSPPYVSCSGEALLKTFLRMPMGNTALVPLSRSFSDAAAACFWRSSSWRCWARASAAGRERQTTTTVETSIAVRTRRMRTRPTMTPVALQVSHRPRRKHSFSETYQGSGGGERRAACGQEEEGRRDPVLLAPSHRLVCAAHRGWQ
ncbi:hypothetical protein PYCCODRAFT_360669 [Trametes coccinea BRFM310]|uniref:Uncharacterized protein n=1 Tax=Trametes coccinea (strain BRFM310) TaxID=1353009 RepID=A0A1Y2J6M1_TRAC3|nr:hypothetical protein PYCCODRAFT_360669 [Trametes coccinea BRFM310]